MNDEWLKYKFKDMPTLLCERLVLRPMCVSDAEDMYDYAKRPETTRFLRWSPHPDVSYTKKYLKYAVKSYREGVLFDWAIIEKASGRMIGTCGFTTIDTEHRNGEIGYVLNPDFHRRGYAPEAARAVLEFGFSELDLHRIEARFMKENGASLKVMQKIGMTFEGYMRDAMYIKGEFRTIGVSAIMRSEFVSAQKGKIMNS